MSDTIVKVRNVSKVYKLYEKPVHRLLESVRISRNLHTEFYALKDVSLEIRRGETVGLIGRNGSGKSTLLKIISGIVSPTSGEVSVNGKVSALLELGAGFNPEYTGRENIFLNGLLNGLTKTEVQSQMQSILSFAEIGDFIDQPVKTYSSGMFVRLAFSVAIHVDPDILIVDEALSVGDIRFQQKCLRKIEDFRSRGKTVIFVSHDLGAVVKFCDRVYWIDKGSVVKEGDPLQIAKEFQAFMMGVPHSVQSFQHEERGEHHNLPVSPLPGQIEVTGDGKAIIRSAGILDSDNRPVEIVRPGMLVRIVINVLYRDDIDMPIVGFSIQDRLGNIVAQTNTYVLNYPLRQGRPGEEVTLMFEMQIPDLNEGEYTISPAVASGTQLDHIQHFLAHDALVFRVVTDALYPLPGTLCLSAIRVKTI
ncbi:ABC transporter ATP-binding protein [Alicyclobacillus sendaiensis]|uniref:ABC transporter ATP-binding protein n=1 Tax=Alicyclobacillus sendaiensis PA2 TaxID=3029425 RepID=A0ABT6Y163_ALISE|nr:ABC transporter ATP-binding protein [Alicyclobacillus sendaiensis]MDI9261083.1 ABC transporter ATP-binding protein [Alicyclobacillus sendaiensis PA2]